MVNSVTKVTESKYVQNKKAHIDGRDIIERLFLEIKSIQEEKNNIIEEI